MDEKIDKAIEELLAQAFRPGASGKSEDVQRFSQAVLNLAHAKQIISANNPPRGAQKNKPNEP